jgi:predicted AlkP superfamily phosphohydrolase/phosphomutase
MPRKRVLAIGLDGYELSLAESMFAEGLLPHMYNLRERSARFRLDHGRARFSGLAWEHFSTGMSPEAIRRWSAVTFDVHSYRAVQVPTSSPPFLSWLRSDIVVFDVPYCDMEKAPNVQGLTNWGAHDPGVSPQSNPDGLREEFTNRFGSYPATKYIYGFTWPSVENTRKAATSLKRAVDVRSEGAIWLLRDRLPDWDLGIVIVSEAHSSIEQMWHGIDPSHDLRDSASAPAARDGLRAIYGAIDDLIGSLMQTFPDAEVVLFAMHGMGTNDADLASMVLLGELLFRNQFGCAYMRTPTWSSHLPNGVPSLPDGSQWHFEFEALIPPLWHFESPAPGIGEDFTYRPDEQAEIEWMPVTRYKPFWAQMEAFALPSFYDGRVRLNLAGRESRGIVPLEKYDSVLLGIRDLISACRDPLTGRAVSAEGIIEQRHPYDIGPTQADLYIQWNGAPTGFVHPDLGQIGPLPYRRTGGHTNPLGFAYIAGSQWEPGDHGVRSSFDVVPTLLSMLGEHDRVPFVSGDPIEPAALHRRST